jgi:hypothetical protein
LIQYGGKKTVGMRRISHRSLALSPLRRSGFRYGATKAQSGRHLGHNLSVFCGRRALVSGGIGIADLGSPFHDAQFAAKVSAASF